MPSRRFPPPWSVEDIGAAFVVKDGSGQQLAYVYYEEEPGRRSAAKLLSKGTPGSQSKLMTTIWASKDANFGVATRHWYDSH
jgi:hypothetical protein